MREPISKPETVQESEPGTDSFPFFEDNKHNFPDLELPIAVRKGTSQCTQHLISHSVSFYKLSSQHKAFTTSLNSIDIS